MSIVSWLRVKGGDGALPKNRQSSKQRDENNEGDCQDGADDGLEYSHTDELLEEHTTRIFRKVYFAMQ